VIETFLTERFEDGRNLEWHADVGFQHNLSSISKLPYSFIPSIPKYRYNMNEGFTTANITSVLDLESNVIYYGQALPSGSDGYWNSFMVDKEMRRVFITYTHDLNLNVSRIRQAMREVGILGVKDTKTAAEAQMFELIILCIGHIDTTTGLTYQTLSARPLTLITWRDIELKIQRDQSRRIAHRVKAYILIPNARNAYLMSLSDRDNAAFENMPTEYLRMISISRGLPDGFDKENLLQRYESMHAALSS
jgi:hypothetical protein